MVFCVRFVWVVYDDMVISVEVVINNVVMIMVNIVSFFLYIFGIQVVVFKVVVFVSLNVIC